MTSRRRTAPNSSPKTVSQLSGPPQIVLDAEQQEKFDQELAWCIRKINCGISSEKDPKKVNDGLKLANNLRSPNVSLLKKRQLMFNMFGDYRLKMKQEEKKQSEAKDLAKIKLTEQTKLENLLKKAKFLRRASTKLKKNRSNKEPQLIDELADLKIQSIDKNITTELKPSQETPKLFVMQKGNTGFKFNFEIDDEKNS